MRFASLLALVASMTLAVTAGATPPNAPPAPHAAVVRAAVQPVRPPEVHSIQVTTAPPSEIHLVTATSSARPTARPTAKPQATTAAHLEAPQLFTGVRALLGSLKERNIAFGVASNNKRAYVIGLVEKLGLGDLLPTEHVVASDWGDTYPNKPSPKILQVLAAKQGTDPKTTIYFGDRPDDVRAARAAGMIGIGISHGDPAVEKEFHDVGASMVITKINEENLGPVLRFVDKVGAKAVYFDWDDTLATNPSDHVKPTPPPVIKLDKTSLVLVHGFPLAA